MRSIDIGGVTWTAHHPREGERVTVKPSAFGGNDGYHGDMFIVEVDGNDYLLRSASGHPHGDVWIHGQRIEGWKVAT